MLGLADARETVSFLVRARQRCGTDRPSAQLAAASLYTKNPGGATDAFTQAVGTSHNQRVDSVNSGGLV